MVTTSQRKWEAAITNVEKQLKIYEQPIHKSNQTAKNYVIDVKFLLAEFRASQEEIGMLQDEIKTLKLVVKNYERSLWNRFLLWWQSK